MPETIYTIPINEAFDKAPDEHLCPFCKLERELEINELDLILGASMMEPDIRVKTNKLGFCPAHFSKMLVHGKRLPLALMLESHLDELYSEITKKDRALSPDKVTKRLDELSSTCYVCDRISLYYKKIMSNAAYMWACDDGFRQKLRAQSGFCAKHFADFVKASSKELSKKQFPDFYDDISDIFVKSFAGLRSDVSLFCKKFDYRYTDEPWGNSKDSVERSIAFLSSVLPSPDKH